MEAREIRIINSKDQHRYKITTAAVTLLQLKEEIEANTGVQVWQNGEWVNSPTTMDITGMSFTEGISNTDMIGDDSVLPTFVPYKGSVTNNLVMLLTSRDKIESGAMSRKDAYTAIKEFNLQEAVQRTYGQNYTRVKTEDLFKIIEGVNVKAEETEGEDTSVSEQTPEETNSVASTKDRITAVHSDEVCIFYDIVKLLTKKNILFNQDVLALSELLSELGDRMKEEAPCITEDDIDMMLLRALNK